MARSFRDIREWDGSKARAFEELCYQLRDATPSGAQLIKTGDPDGGLEWYVRLRNGVEWGWQAKYSFQIDTLLGLMEKSLKTVVAKRKNCRKLTFCVPFDLPDARVGSERKSARQKFEDRKASWKVGIPGADRVTIELISAGGLLDRLTGHPNERGIGRFFWDQEIFSNDWLARRLTVTTETAGDRYDRKLHVELPIAFALEGLAGSELFWQRYRERRASVAAAANRVVACEFAGIGVNSAMGRVRAELASWSKQVPDLVAAPERLPCQHVLKLSKALEDVVDSAYPDPSPERTRKRTEKQKKFDQRREDLRRALTRLDGALSEFAAFLNSGAAMAAAQGALLLTGDAGQGKTHLLCDAGERALAAGRPALVFLGGRLSGRHFWSDCADILGLAQVGGEALRGAMRAAAEASGTPFLLLVDALNESAEPSAWRNELPGVLAELADDPWISLGVSVRSSFLPVVLPPEGLGDRVARVDHPGFEGRELEASERFFDVFEMERPLVPLLTPEFTNPLFLKLYCESLKAQGVVTPPAAAAHVSDVFDQYLASRAERITSSLELDPLDRAVQRAVERFSEELVSRNVEHIPRHEARDLVDAFGPANSRWRQTLFAQLLNEGLLASDVVWSRNDDESVHVVRFVYQRFSDYRAANVLVKTFADAATLEQAVADGEPLRDAICSAAAGWIEALSVLVPERLGIELLDAADWDLSVWRREQWEGALIRSVVSRRPNAMTTRARELIASAEVRSKHLSEEALGAILAVAAVPDHPLNADHLHRVLLRSPMPERDTRWGVRTFYAFGDEGPLDRLLRWAARGPYPGASPDVLRLAGTLLVWTFTSPNRFMRDYATKALRQLLDRRLDVVEALVRQFGSCDDPYVIERLAVVTHGCLLTAGDQDPDGALSLARAIRDEFLIDEAVPNVLTRDAIRGCFEWALRRELIETREYQAVCPPYGSAPPESLRSKEQLEDAYDLRKQDDEGNYVVSPYARIYFSVFRPGDFGRYVIESKLHEFTDLPLGQPLPRSSAPDPEEPEHEALAERHDPERQRDPDVELDEYEELLGALGYVPREELPEKPDLPKPRPANRTNDFSGEFGQRWVFERALSLGWTPERFGSFDDRNLRDNGRRSHKSERFGKKYQWIALRELLARVADNFHMTGEWSGTERFYQGPWQFHDRDIDPTLPPPLRHRDDEDDLVRSGPTFEDDAPGAWWGFGGPRYLASDPLPREDWASNLDDVPTFEQLVRKTDPEGVKWIVLQGYGKWEEERVGDNYWDEEGVRRDLWSHLFAWLVQIDELPRLEDFLRTRSFEGRWMPEPAAFSGGAYLAETPWAAAANQYEREWEAVGPAHDDLSDVRVLPAWESYGWEGEGLDCSVADSVSASMPVAELFGQAELHWVVGTRSWQNRKGSVVAQHRSGPNDHHALLVRESWLKKALVSGGWGLVLGRLGEKTLFTRGISPDILGDWTVLSDLATFDRRGVRMVESRVISRTGR